LYYMLSHLNFPFELMPHAQFSEEFPFWAIWLMEGKYRFVSHTRHSADNFRRCISSRVRPVGSAHWWLDDTCQIANTTLLQPHCRHGTRTRLVRECWFARTPGLHVVCRCKCGVLPGVLARGASDRGQRGASAGHAQDDV